MAALVAEAGLDDEIEVHSAGTADWHVGRPPDDRAVAEAARRGLTLTSRASTFMPGDAGFYDLVLAMDASNHADLVAISDPVHHDRIRLLREHDPEAVDSPEVPGSLDVPDPWHGGPEGFVAVYDMIERSCRALLADLAERRPRP